VVQQLVGGGTSKTTADTRASRVTTWLGGLAAGLEARHARAPHACTGLRHFGGDRVGHSLVSIYS